ncbi:hypothetical protein AC1031_010523 [Aphanomyces cochlioides]|nr:hypothetical protein AC1031_010523 [Aphanomyces cochlioides]
MPTIVIIRGWMGGNPRSVAKYASLYQELLGLVTYTLLSKPIDIFSSPATVHSATIKDFKEWLVKRFDSVDGGLTIMPHMLSNGGCWSWTCFQRHLQQAGMSFRVPCMVIDSALNIPDDRSNAAVAFSASIKSRAMRQFCTEFLSVILANYFFLAYDVFAVKSLIEWIFNQLICHDKDIPKLFLYSTSDQIMPPHHVEHAIAAAKDLKTPVVQAVNFETSPHVAHLAKAPELYMKSVQTFSSKFIQA